jgi:hypothetical protein
MRSGGDKRTRDEPVRPKTDLAASTQPESTPTGNQEPTEDDIQAEDTPGLLLLDAPNMDDDVDGSSSLSSLPSDMEVDETQH